MHNPGRLPRPAENSRGAANVTLCAVIPREIATGLITPRNDNTCVRNDNTCVSATTKIITAKLNYSSLFYYE